MTNPIVKQALLDLCDVCSNIMALADSIDHKSKP
jgi:hypothetical protein